MGINQLASKADLTHFHSGFDITSIVENAETLDGTHSYGFAANIHDHTEFTLIESDLNTIKYIDNQITLDNAIDQTDMGIVVDNGANAYYPSLLFDDNAFETETAYKFRCFYSTGTAIKLITSMDGITWTSPVSTTGLSTAHHPTILYSRSGFGVQGNIKYKIQYQNSSVSNLLISTIRYAESADGTTQTNDQAITQDNTYKLITGNSGNWNAGTWGFQKVFYNGNAKNTGNNPFDYKYCAYYDCNTGTTYQTTGLAYSIDGKNWFNNQTSPVLDRNSGDTTAQDYYTASFGSFIRDINGFHCQYSGGKLSVYTDNFGIGYAHSVDGIIQNKDISNPIFTVLDGLTYRDERCYTPTVIDNGTGSIYMLYTAQGTAQTGRKKLGLATLKCASTRGKVTVNTIKNDSSAAGNTLKETLNSLVSHTHLGTYADITHLHYGNDITTAVANATNSDTLDGTHSSGFSASVHNHDSSYYNESEIDNKLSLKSDSTHNHTGTYANLTHVHAGTDVTTAVANATNADTLDGTHSSGFAASTHNHDATNITSGILPAARFDDTAHGNRSGGSLHSTVTESVNGFMIASDKTKLDTIAVGAEVNQNAFSIVKVGATNINADSKTDTLELIAGTNIALTPNASTDEVTIAITGTVADATNADTLDGTHSSGFAASIHSHDYSYYTESEIDNKLLLKSDSTHNHSGTYAILAHNHAGGDVTTAVANATNSDTLDGTHSSGFAASGHIHSNYQDTTAKGSANGYASLDGAGKIPTSQLPGLALTDVYTVADQTSQLALNATTQEGDVCIRSDINKSYVKNDGTANIMADQSELLTPTDVVTSVNGNVGVITINASNTAFTASGDITSNTVQTAIQELDSEKAKLSHTHTGSDITSSVSNADTLDTYHAGHSNGQIPISDTTVNTNLNADFLDGTHSSGFAASSHIHDHGVDLTGLSDDDHTTYLNNTRHDTTTRHGSGVIDHGQIDGLADDDHSNYVHISTARTITAQHSFSPGTATAPFALGANAQGQLVTGLNADKLDGTDSSGFAASGHNHDSSYYTESEMDTKLSLKSDTTHNHDHGALTGLTDDDHTAYLNNTRHDTTTRHGSGVVDHGQIDGLADDDHSNYVHISTARTITAQHSFSPGSTAAPFALGANAQGQLVTGLNADKLDGTDSSGFAASSHTHAGGDVTTAVANATNSDTLDTYHAGHSNNQIPISDTTVNTNLNADLLDGTHSSGFAASSHTHDHGADLAGLADDDHTQYLNNTRHDTTTRHGSGVVDHGQIDGLADDDHSNYVHISTARTITAQHSFSPGTAIAPFALGANAQGQLVTGLNADKLDGTDSSGFAASSHTHAYAPTSHTHAGGDVTTAVANATNADTLDTYHASNATGSIPISNGTVNTNLNSDMLDGTHSSGFAASTHDHNSTYAPVAKSSNYTITDTDNYDTIFISGNTTITLPTASKSRLIKFAKTDTGTIAIITGAGSDTIQGNTYITLNSQYSTVMLGNDGISTQFEF